MATSWIFSPHSPTIQLVSLLLQLLSPLTFQEWPDIGLRFPSRKYSFAKAQKQVMLGNLENMIIFKESGRPSKPPFLPPSVAVADQGDIGNHPIHCLFLLLLSDGSDSQIRKAIRKVSEWCGERGTGGRVRHFQAEHLHKDRVPSSQQGWQTAPLAVKVTRR